jgi:hypothetical protein
LQVEQPLLRQAHLQQQLARQRCVVTAVQQQQQQQNEQQQHPPQCTFFAAQSLVSANYQLVDGQLHKLAAGSSWMAAHLRLRLVLRGVSKLCTNPLVSRAAHCLFAKGVLLDSL